MLYTSPVTDHNVMPDWCICLRVSSLYYSCKISEKQLYDVTLLTVTKKPKMVYHFDRLDPFWIKSKKEMESIKKSPIFPFHLVLVDHVHLCQKIINYN